MSVEPSHRIVLVRHAKAEPKQKTAHPDHERPLTERGHRDAALAGRRLADAGPVLDRALVSTSVRTRQTWESITAELSEPPGADFEDLLYRADRDTLLARIGHLPEGSATVALVGHNPGIHDLAVGLTGSGPDDLRARLAESGFRTAGVVVLSLPGPWAGITYGAARLEAYWSPHS